MKLRFLFLALAALTLAPVLPSCTYSQVLHNQENNMAMLNRTLANVQDKTTADAAAPVVRMCGSELRQDISKIVANGKPNVVQLAMLKQSYQNSNIKAESKSALTQLFRIYGQGFYGSTELKQAFLDMLLKSGSTTAETTTTTQSSSQLQSLQNSLKKLQNQQNQQNIQKLQSPQNIQKLQMLKTQLKTLSSQS